jgi:hypothetical protein
MTQEDQRMSGALQENLLVLLCFDDKNCKLVRAALTPHLFESAPFREIAGYAIDFIDQYGEAIKDHLPDQMEHILEGEDERKSKHYKRILEDLFLNRDSINSEYVVSQLHKFVRLQKFKSGLVEAVQLLDERGDIDQAESIMTKAMEAQVVSFEPGLRLDSPEDVGAIVDSPEEEGFTLGIPAFDDLGIYPRRKELFAFVAARGKGKSWFATHCAKRALLQRWSPIIITLEMSERRYGARMLQSFFSISRRHATTKITRIEKNDDGKLQELVQEEVQRQTLRDSGIRETLVKRAKREFSRRRPFRIKEFASGGLTMPMLEAYIEGLIRHEKVQPDALIVDYPRLFKLSTENLRLELGSLNVALRGLAKKLNCAVIVLVQGNRESEDAFLVTAKMAEEDISLKATADVVVTYSQTRQEKALGLARLFADKVRNDDSGILALISQAYGIGQFCLDSLRLVGEYWDDLSSKMDRKERGERRRRERGEEDEDRPARRRTREEDDRPSRRRGD